MPATLLELGADANDGSLYHAVEMRDATTDWRAHDGSRLRSDHPNELTALDLAKLLLEAGADPNKPFVGQMHTASMCCDPKANATPFYRAAVAADVEALKLMIALRRRSRVGAAVDARPGRGSPGNTGGKTALMVAMNGGKGVGMAGGPGDIREGIEPPFREVANRKSRRCGDVAARRGRRTPMRRRPTATRRCTWPRSRASSRSCARSSKAAPT